MPICNGKEKNQWDDNTWLENIKGSQESKKETKINKNKEESRRRFGQPQGKLQSSRIKIMKKQTNR